MANPIICDHDLVISGVKSASPGHNREGVIVGRELSKRGVGVLLTLLDWPRDTLYFHDDGTFTYVKLSDSRQVQNCPHEAYSSGKYLLGRDFIISSDNLLPSKRRQTEQILNVAAGYYYPLGGLTRAFRGIKVSGNIFFYDSPNPLNHMDQFFNLINTKQTILGYDEPLSVQLGEDMARVTGYSFKTIPKAEARFAAIGFIELGDHIVVDCRAEQTIGVLEGLGCNVFPTPVPLDGINQYGGSLRCITREMPKIIPRLRFYDFKHEGHDRKAGRSYFSDLRGYRVIMDEGSSRRLREPICTHPDFALN